MNSSPKFDYQQLDSGLGLALVQIPWARSVGVELLVDVGSRDESSEQEGAAHFVEHMLFKGTKKRPKPIDLTAQIEAQGASVNAWTSQECTAVELSGPKQSLPVLLDAALDMISAPLFQPEEFEREKEVILEEIAGYQDDPAEACTDLLPQALWGKASLQTLRQLAHPIAGTKQSVLALSLDDLRTFHAQHYRAHKATLAIAGNFHPTELHALVKNCPQLNSQQAIINSNPGPSSYQDFAAQHLCEQRPNLQQRHVALGWKAPSALSKERFASRLALTALAGTMSSRLFQILREEQGLVYAISDEYVSLRDCGSVQLFLEAESEKMTQALEIITQELNRLATQSFSQRELDCARGYLLGQLEASLDSPTMLCRWAAEAGRLEQDIPQPQRAIENYQSLTQESLSKAIAQWLRGGSAQAEVSPKA